jgi:putative peptidoglycan lipid II flippase
MIPAIFGSSVAQINLLFDTLIASFLVVGSVSWLYYSDRLVEFPLGVFGIALATVILPRLSSQFAARSGEGFSATLDWAMRWTWLITVPAAAGLFVLAGPVLATLFEYGAFASHDTAMARMSLMAYAFGLIGFSYVKVLAPGYFSRQDTKTPVRIGIIALVANMVMNVAIVVPWVMLGYPGAHAGLALATSISAALNASMLYRGLRRDGALSHGAGSAAFYARVLAATIVMSAVVWWFMGPRDAWHAMGAAERVARLATAIALGGGTYAAVLVALGLRPAALKVRIIAGSA